MGLEKYIKMGIIGEGSFGKVSYFGLIIYALIADNRSRSRLNSFQGLFVLCSCHITLYTCSTPMHLDC